MGFTCTIHGDQGPYAARCEPCEGEGRGYVDEDDLAENFHRYWPGVRGVDARLIARHYGAHVDDALAVLHRDDRFTCQTAEDPWRSFSAWGLAETPPRIGLSDAVNVETNPHEPWPIEPLCCGFHYPEERYS